MLAYLRTCDARTCSLDSFYFTYDWLTDGLAQVSCLVESREQAGRYRHLHALQPAGRLSFEGVR